VTDGSNGLQDFVIDSWACDGQQSLWWMIEVVVDGKGCGDTSQVV